MRSTWPLLKVPCLFVFTPRSFYLNFGAFVFVFVTVRGMDESWRLFIHYLFISPTSLNRKTVLPALSEASVSTDQGDVPVMMF